MICSYAQVAGLRLQPGHDRQGAAAPLFALAAPAEAGGYGGVSWAGCSSSSSLLDMLAVLIGISVASSRGIFAMARDHRFPAVARHGLRPARHAARPPASSCWPSYLVVALTRRAGLFACRGRRTTSRCSAGAPRSAASRWRCIYLLLSSARSAGCATTRPGRGPGRRVVGVIVTAGAIFGAIYKVPAPTIWCVGVADRCSPSVLAYVVPGRQSGHTSTTNWPRPSRGRSSCSGMD